MKKTYSNKQDTQPQTIPSPRPRMTSISNHSAHVHAASSKRFAEHGQRHALPHLLCLERRLSCLTAFQHASLSKRTKTLQKGTHR